ncbi:MAG: metallophosphoesterase [Bacteroidales bacterium]
MNCKNLSLTTFFLLLFFISNLAKAGIPERKGWWKFDDPSHPLKAETGYPASLVLSGSHSLSDGPEAGNGAILIGPGSFYKMKHEIAPNGGGSKVNEYTLMFDFKVSSNDTWHSFFQTNINNADDGDFFINPSGNIGVAAVGYSDYSVVPENWYRLIIAVDNGSRFSCYIDGQLLMDGATQSVDGRFALDSLLLLFADENGEDAPLVCSELALWDTALTAEQAAELGGYGHEITPFLMTRIPYLQSPARNSMTVCWHDSSSLGTAVEFGIDSTLGNIINGSSELIKTPYRWHTVKITDLQPATRYFYRLTSGGFFSPVYSFRTLPDTTSNEIIRFLILGDTHASDTTMPRKIMRAAKQKIMEVYGGDIESNLTCILQTGDLVVSGGIVEQYSSEFFYPFSMLSTHVPVMTVIGNHEGESVFYYKYMKYDDLSAFPKQTALKEKVWEMRVANSLFIGMNTNITAQYGNTMSNWLDTRLAQVEPDTSIDFVFLFFHHPPFSELWKVVNTFDDGSNYVRDKLFPVIKKYSKVQEMHYGHTHGFERGAIPSETPGGDFRIVCGGGSGGPLDPWADGANLDYPEIHRTISNYEYLLLEIDPGERTFNEKAYSLGTLSSPENSTLLDHWYRKPDQPAPEKPLVFNASLDNSRVIFHSSLFAGVDSLMTVNLQIIDSASIPVIVLDTLIHWENIYGVNAQGKPVDLNAGIDLYNTAVNRSRFIDHSTCSYRIRYRDHNLMWSDWSEPLEFSPVSVIPVTGKSTGPVLHQNYPNPFRDRTNISYYLSEPGSVTIQVCNALCQVEQELYEGNQATGLHSVTVDLGKSAGGLYFFRMVTGDSVYTRKMLKME